MEMTTILHGQGTDPETETETGTETGTETETGTGIPEAKTETVADTRKKTETGYLESPGTETTEATSMVEDAQMIPIRASHSWNGG